MKVKNEVRKTSTLLIAAGIFLGLGLGGFWEGLLMAFYCIKFSNGIT
jgi:uncharacterized membrane protein